MSCNIDNWKTVKIENLVVPVKAFYKHSRKDWHPSQPKITNVDTMEVVFECGDPTIHGILKDGMLTITKLNISGEGSGIFNDWIFKEALKESAGSLKAVLIYESGEVYEFNSIDGIITETTVNLFEVPKDFDSFL